MDMSNVSFVYIDINNISNDKAILMPNKILSKAVGIGIIIIITIAIIPNATTISPNFIVPPPKIIP